MRGVDGVRSILILVMLMASSFGPGMSRNVAAASGAWPTFQGDPGRSGATEDPGPGRQPELLWRADTGTGDGRIGFFTDPVVVDGVVYTAGAYWDDRGFLVAADAQTGTTRWELELEEDPAWATVVVDGGTVYVPGHSGSVFAVSAATGSLQWHVELGRELLGYPVIASATTLIVQGNGDIYALDRATGAERWRYSYEVGDLYSLEQAPAVADGVVYAAAFDDEETGIIVALDAEQGEERWRFRASHPKLAQPSVVAGTVFVGSEGAVYALDAASGEQRWVADVPGLVGSALAVAEGSVYVHVPDTVLALDATTGAERWRSAQAVASTASPVVAGGLVYVGGDALAEEGVAASAGFFALDAATGELVWHLPVGTVHSAPAVVGTSVLFLTGDRVLYAVDALDAGAAEPGRTHAGAYVSPILFSSEVDAHDRPVDAGTTFTDIRALYAGVDLVGMADGTPYQISWTHDGDVVGVLDETWSENSAGRHLSGDELENGVIPAGEWEVVVTVDGEVVRRATAIVRTSATG